MAAPLGIGLIGAGWITRAHGHAIHTINHMKPLSRPLRITALSARRPEQGEPMARALEADRFTTDWQDVIDDPRVDVVANLLRSTEHVAATEAALAAGKPVLCEKPLGVDRHEASRLRDAQARAGVPAVVGYNYRYIPAMRLARELVDSGRLGETVQFRALYLQDHAAGRPPARVPNGSRAVTDYAHIVDFLRYLGNEAESVQASSAVLTESGFDVEDAYVAAINLRGGGLGSLEASRVAWGWKGRQVVEVNGTQGSLWWDMEDLNRLHVFQATDERERSGGFRDVLVSQPDHPFMDWWWEPGHTVGWAESFAHEWRDFLSAVLDDRPISPEQASFEDGYQVALLCDAIIASAAEGRRVRIDELTATPAASG
jgi:predicted dehydrogenase